MTCLVQSLAARGSPLAYTCNTIQPAFFIIPINFFSDFGVMGSMEIRKFLKWTSNDGVPLISRGYPDNLDNPRCCAPDTNVKEFYAQIVILVFNKVMRE